MKKIKIVMENCYGIKKLNHFFEFDDKNIILIYASNGTMKSSFAKTLKDINNPQEKRYNTTPNICTIIKENDSIVTQDEIVVTDSEKDVYNAEYVQKLLASPELKKEYDNIYAKIKQKKELLLQKLMKLSGNKNLSELEIEILDLFGNYGKDTYNILRNIDINSADEEFSEIIYKKEFNEKVINILQNNQTRIFLKEYIVKYDELLKTSKIFCDNKINQYNAENIAKVLDKNNFYKTNHKMILNMEENIELDTNTTFTKIIEEEKRKILSNQTLMLNFSKIESSFSNEETRHFRDFLVNNQFIIPELIDLKKFKDMVYRSYLKITENEVREFLNIYEENIVKIKVIQEKLQKEKTLWEDTINEFKNRFKDVPYDIRIENKMDAILNEEIPLVKIVFGDGINIKEYIREEFLADENVSKGEARALNLLEFIYLIKSRGNQETLLILDDIVDSYDYKNKYAILEYIYDFSQKGNIKTILLTHNFDFYRLVASRLRIENTKENKKLFMVTNKNGIIEFEPGKYTRNIFQHWKKLDCKGANLDIVLASIAFFRNIFEIIDVEKNNEYSKLTSILHVMPSSREINLKFLIDIISEMWKKDIEIKELQYDDKSQFDENSILQDVIVDRAEYLADNFESIGIDLEKKIILSVATRIKAETYMNNNISNKTSFEGKENQYNFMLKQYESEHPIQKEKIYVLRRVNMITPESIHINSFMYEPIIDMTIDELIKIFEDVKNL